MALVGVDEESVHRIPLPLRVTLDPRVGAGDAEEREVHTLVDENVSVAHGDSSVHVESAVLDVRLGRDQYLHANAAEHLVSGVEPALEVNDAASGVDVLETQGARVERVLVDVRH